MARGWIMIAIKTSRFEKLDVFSHMYLRNSLLIEMIFVTENLSIIKLSTYFSLN